VGPDRRGHATVMEAKLSSAQSGFWLIANSINLIIS
jgi:hypothetical protein